MEEQRPQRMVERARAQEQERQREITATLKDFERAAQKRRMGASEYTDRGSQWHAMSQPVKQLREQYNRMSEGDRAKVLDRLRDRMTRDPEAHQHVQGTFTPERHRDRDREMER